MLASLDLTGYCMHRPDGRPTSPAAHRTQPAIPLTCEHLADGHGTGRRCDLAHPHDITQWCFPCARRLILNLRAGDCDSWADDFAGHPESLDVIKDAMDDLTFLGPWWYREADDRAATGGPGAWDAMEPTDEELDEIRGLARAWEAGDEDGEWGFAGDAVGERDLRRLAGVEANR